MKPEEIENLYQDFLERKMDWEEAVEEAKYELGYSPDEYIEDWEEIVDTAKEILNVEYEEFYDELLDITHNEYQKYLESDKWKKLRLKILERDNFTCQDCNNKAIGVHHLNYDYLGTDKEEKYCISICKNCHLKRHNIKRK